MSASTEDDFEFTTEFDQSIKLPSTKTITLMQRMSITNDMPLYFDYWVNALKGQALIGQRKNGEKILVHAAEEYTSPIKKIFKIVDDTDPEPDAKKKRTDIIVVTMNSIYVVPSTIKQCAVNNI